MAPVFSNWDMNWKWYQLMEGRQIPCNSWLLFKTSSNTSSLTSRMTSWICIKSSIGSLVDVVEYPTFSLFISPSSFELMEDILFLIFRMESRRRSEAEDWQRKFKAFFISLPLPLFHLFYLILQLSSSLFLSLDVMWWDQYWTRFSSPHIKNEQFSEHIFMKLASQNWLSFGNFSNKGWFQPNSLLMGKFPKLWEMWCRSPWPIDDPHSRSSFVMDLSVSETSFSIHQKSWKRHLPPSQKMEMSLGILTKWAKTLHFYLRIISTQKNK